jgi:type II secretory pathway component PulF
MAESTSIPEISRFFTALGDDLKAGQPVLRSLRRIEKELSDAPLLETLKAMADDIENGSTLSQAMEQHPDAFDEATILLVKGGDAYGRLPARPVSY